MRLPSQVPLVRALPQLALLLCPPFALTLSARPSSELNYIEMYWATTKMETRRRETFTWKSLLESMFYAFGQPDCLQAVKEAERYPLEPERTCPIHSIFRQKVSCKVASLFRLYLNNPGKGGLEVAELRISMKKFRAHRRPSTAGPSIGAAADADA